MVRAIGPPMSCVLDSGTMPVRLDKSLRAAQADEIVVRRRNADRSAGVAAHAAGGEVRRHRGARSAARPARVAIEVVGVLRLPEARADR